MVSKKKLEESPLYTRLEGLCRSKGITIAKMSRDLGISNSAATAWRNGSKPHIDTLSKMAEYLSSNIEYLLSGDTVEQYAGCTDGAASPPLYDAGRLLAALEIAQNNIKEVLRDSAEKTAAIKTMADSNAVLVDTNSKLGAWAAKQLNLFDELESQGIERRSARGA
jgi:transcriptional regulator with XRE-family HTH domain